MERYLGAAYNKSEERIKNNKIRRKRELRRRLLILTVSFVLFVSLICLFVSSKSVASDGSEEVLYKYYKSIQIQSGDTLYDLSLEYVNPEFNDTRSFIEEVKFINNLDDNAFLNAGNYIIIPYYDTLKG